MNGDNIFDLWHYTSIEDIRCIIMYNLSVFNVVWYIT